MVNLVTGAFSFSGSYIAKEMLQTSTRIRTLTGHFRDVPYSDRVDVYPYNFGNHEALVESLDGVENFVNTYWIRFPRGSMTWERAVENSRLLFDACRDAGVRRIIHLSVTNPSLDSPYPYFRGKAQVEEHLRNSGVRYSILRPALIFEIEDILLNNIAYLLRRSPIFGIFGTGRFKVQPISQRDLAKVVVSEFKRKENITMDTIGPETYTFMNILKMLNRATSSRTLLLPFPGIFRWIPFMMSKFFGLLLRDVLLTRYEMDALRDNLLLTNSEPVGETSFREWIEENGDLLGRSYAHELNRHYK